MKKLFLLIAAIAMLCAAVSCNNDDEPKRGNGVFTVNSPMINHIYNTSTNQMVGIAATHNKLTFDTVNHTGSLELYYNNGNGTLKLTDLKGTPKRGGFYELTSPSYPQFKGYVDLNQHSLRYNYTTQDGLQIISTISEIFFLKTQTTIVYSDTTPTSKSENVMYEFDIEPNSMTATIKVSGGLVHEKDIKNFECITSNNVPITATPNGYAIQAQNLMTIARYTAYDPSTGSTFKETDKYPFKTFNATIDLLNDHLDANYMIGNDATVTASGRTYSD